MKMSKKILLSLIFSLSFTLTIFYFIDSILNTIKPNWLEGDFSKIGTIMWWVLFGLFFLSALSSFFWLINLDSGFWLWKVPALLILPFSIPYLILDYLELNKKTKFTEVNKKSEPEITQWTFLSIILSINFFIVLGQISIISFIVVPLSKWAWFWTFVPLIIICGSAFLILDYFYPNKVFQRLSYLGLTFNWLYLFFNIIDKKQINYFFKAKNTENKII